MAGCTGHTRRKEGFLEGDTLQSSHQGADCVDLIIARHYAMQEVIMNAILIFLTSIGTAYLVARLRRRGTFGLIDLVLGVFCGCASLSLAQFLSAEGAGGVGLPLFIACALTLGLESLPHRAPVR
jgi:hypothetical protein